MLELIVLGQIPGTQIYINFQEAVILWAIALIGSYVFIKNRQYQRIIAAAETEAVYLNLIGKKKRRPRHRG